MLYWLFFCAFAQISTQNIDLLLPEPPPSTVETWHLLEQAQKQAALIDRQFGITTSPVIRLKLTGTIEQYQKECRTSWPSGGAYLPYEDLICLPPLTQLYQLNNLPQLLRHELAHARLHNLLAHCPLWVEEYMAMLAGGEVPAPCPDTPGTCPTNQELLQPKNQQAANTSYCQTYQCGIHFISSQTAKDVANICRNFPKGW